MIECPLNLKPRNLKKLKSIKQIKMGRTIRNGAQNQCQKNPINNRKLKNDLPMQRSLIAEGLATALSI